MEVLGDAFQGSALKVAALFHVMLKKGEKGHPREMNVHIGRSRVEEIDVKQLKSPFYRSHQSFVTSLVTVFHTML